VASKAKPYCTCYTKEEIKEKPWLSIKNTIYREVDCSDGDTCDRCGHYVRWMIDFDPTLHKHKVRKHRNLEKDRKKYDYEYSITYEVSIYSKKHRRYRP
tara:strand:+ start:72 stop:368 length:297 start_codon:yes stop_codon:yes gene_type:complete